MDLSEEVKTVPHLKYSSRCWLFNTNMYDHKRPKTTAFIKVTDQGNEVANEGNDNEGFIQMLNDDEELFREPVFFTH